MSDREGTERASEREGRRRARRDGAARASQDAVLFCPFCREAFEGRRECPEHDLPLVPFDRLEGVDVEADDDGLPGDDERLDAFDPRFGRALVGGGCLLFVVGFLCPLAVIAVPGHGQMVVSGPSVAATHAPALWALPMCGLGGLLLLGWRRTPRQMRSVRIVVPLLVSSVALSTWAALRRADRWAALLADLAGGAVSATTTVSWGVGVLALGGLLVLIGAVRLGVVPRREVHPHGAGPG